MRKESEYIALELEKRYADEELEFLRAESHQQFRNMEITRRNYEHVMKHEPIEPLESFDVEAMVERQIEERKPLLKKYMEALEEERR
jgi:hypothetical protein